MCVVVFVFLPLFLSLFVFLVFVVVAVVAVVVDVVCFCFIVDFIYCSVCFNVHWPVFAGKKHMNALSSPLHPQLLGNTIDRATKRTKKLAPMPIRP